jgi:hypothetical protein
MEVLRVGLEVVGQVVDALGQDCNLHFGGTRIALGEVWYSAITSVRRSAVIDITCLHQKNVIECVLA